MVWSVDMSNPFRNFQYLSQINQVLDYLYIGGFSCVQEGNLKDLGITCIVDATNVPRRPPNGFDYLKIAVDDNERSKLDQYFDRVADKIHHIRLSGGKTLVHCAAGISRSASLCLVYLVKYENMTLRDAYGFLRNKRPIISPNNGFWRQMIAFELRLKGEATVTMIRPRYRELPDVYFSEFLNRNETSLGTGQSVVTAGREL